jgi:hypothetical protein
VPLVAVEGVEGSSDAETVVGIAVVVLVATGVEVALVTAPEVVLASSVDADANSCGICAPGWASAVYSSGVISNSYLFPWVSWQSVHAWVPITVASGASWPDVVLYKSAVYAVVQVSSSGAVLVAKSDVVVAEANSFAVVVADVDASEIAGVEVPIVTSVLDAVVVLSDAASVVEAV